MRIPEYGHANGKRQSARPDQAILGMRCPGGEGFLAHAAFDLFVRQGFWNLTRLATCGAKNIDRPEDTATVLALPGAYDNGSSALRTLLSPILHACHDKPSDWT
jgi:hypothetical protein